MSIAQMSIRFSNEQAAVFVAYPGGDGLKVHAFLDAVADEEVPEAMMREMGEAVELACGVQGILGVSDRHQGLIG